MKERDDTPSESIKSLLATYAELSEKLEQSRVERCVTFIDVAGYTEYVDKHDDFAGRLRVQTAGKTVVPCVEAHDGKIVKEIGDAWMVMFKDPNQAASAAIQIQRQIHSTQAEEKDPIRLKVGIHYGRLLEDEEDLFGDVVNVSSRLMSNCQGGHILVSEDVHRCLDPYYRNRCVAVKGLELRGKSKPALAYELEWIEKHLSRANSLSKDGLVLEVQWAREEAKVSLRNSQEKTLTLISYERQPLDHQSIDSLSAQIVQTIRLANMEGGTTEYHQELQKLGRDLYEGVLPPEIRQQLKESDSKNLFLSLDDGCVHLPWELLFDGSEFLCCRFAMGRSVRTQQRIRTKPRRIPSESFSLLIVSDPCGDLPAAQEEGKDLLRFLQPDHHRVDVTLFNGRVARETVWDALPKADVLHYCGHSDFNHEAPDRSGLVLHDGRLTAGDLEAILKENQPMPLLVFNNSCNSGTTKSWESLDDGWSYGLANAFLMVGCTHYIGAISDLVDSSSKQFPTLFYTHLRAGRSVGESLQLARIAHREEYGESDLTWSQFVLYGDPEGTVLASDQREEDEEDTHAPETARRYQGPPQPPSTQPQRFTRKQFLLVCALAIILGGVFLIHLTTQESASTKIMPIVDRGLQLKEEGRLEQALATFRRAHESAPENLFVQSLISECEEDIAAAANEEHWENIRESIKRIKQFAANSDVDSDGRDRWTSRPSGIAILDFEVMGEFPNMKAQVEELRFQLGQEILKNNRWLLIQQDQIDDVLDQLEIDASGLTNSQYASAIGEFFGACGLLGGTIQSREQEKTVFLSVTDTETRLVAASANESSTDELGRLAEGLATKLIDQLEREFPLRGRITPTQDGVILNIGSDHGVQPGQKFAVRVKEPDERSVLRKVGFPILAEIKVEEVDEENSFCLTSENLDLFEVGMRAEYIAE